MRYRISYDYRIVKDYFVCLRFSPLLRFRRKSVPVGSSVFTNGQCLWIFVLRSHTDIYIYIYILFTVYIFFYILLYCLRSTYSFIYYYIYYIQTEIGPPVGGRERESMYYRNVTTDGLLSRVTLVLQNCTYYLLLYHAPGMGPFFCFTKSFHFL